MENYQKILEENKKLKYQVEKLEKKVEHLNQLVEKKLDSNRKMFEKYTQRGRDVNRLKVHIELLEAKIKELEGGGATKA